MSSTSTRPTVHALPGWQRALLLPAGWLMRLWGMSLKFDLTPESHRAYCWQQAPIALVLWHNRLFLASEIFRRFRGARTTYALVSASKDGAWLEAFFALGGMNTIRGSSSKLGREAILTLASMLKAGNDVGITPDGPRGPRYEMKGGGLLAARRARAPLLVIGGVFEDGWQLRSWDRFWLPRPFSRVRMHARIIPVDALDDGEAAVAMLRDQLLGMNPDVCEQPLRPVI